MTSDLRILAEYRNAILLAEVGAWLHMLGKYNYEFVKNPDNPDKYDYKNFFKNLDDRELRAILTDNWPQKIWKINKPSELNDDALKSLGQFMEKHTNHSIGVNLLRILVDSHGRGSGTEKGILNDGSYDGQGEKESYKQVHLATAFGYEAEPIDESALNKRKDLIYKFLEDQLTVLKGLLYPNSPCSHDKWREWRQPFIERLREDFSTTVGDTRRPINDVTLWDQTVATVAFFKAELAEVILTGWKDPLNVKFKYRILHVAIDGEEFIAQSPGIGDVLARKQLIEEAFDNIKYLIEIKYPLGLEVYRSINGIVFLVPDVDNLLNCNDDQNKKLSQLINEEFNIVFNGEVSAKISLSKGSRNVFTIGKELVENVALQSPTVEFLKESWNTEADKCTICQVRPQGYGAELIKDYKNNDKYYKEKAQKRKICCICMERLQGRSEEWATKKLNKTIWIDEVTDTNGRVALVAGKFDLEHWKNGELISTFRNPIDSCGTTFSEIVKEFDGNKKTKLTNLQNYKIIGETYAKDIEELKKHLIDDEDLGEPEFSTISDNEKLALAVWRKPPSFARLRRVWETTQDFWENTIIGRLSKENIIGTIGPRLIITGTLSKDVGDYHAYDVELKKGVGTCFVYDKKKNRFINVYNLRYIARRLGLQSGKKDLTNEEAAQKIKDYIEVEKQGSLELFEEFSQNGKLVRAATIKQCKVTIEQHNYIPAIPILSDPEQFMALVPADKALIIANHIRIEYENKFSKVKNRLPLHLNIIFFNRKQPLYAALDAARKMLARRSKYDILWEVQKDNDRIMLKRVETNTLNRSCEVLVSHRLGDPNKKDVWYPYFFAETKAQDAKEFSERDHHFRALFHDKNSYKMKDLVHIMDLNDGDKIYYTTSTMDFQLLDTTTRRFELVYENEMRLLRPMEKWATRSFMIEDLEIMDSLWKELSKLTSAQIQQLAGLLDDWHVRWQITDYNDKTYEEFSSYALKRAFGKLWFKLSEKDRHNLKNWAVNGRLLALFELYLKILKQKPEGDMLRMEVQT